MQRCNDDSGSKFAVELSKVEPTGLDNSSSTIAVAVNDRDVVETGGLNGIDGVEQRSISIATSLDEQPTSSEAFPA
ncbi:MAG: hypothetical protein KatS3mg105_4487 [Gemmatales bacterium]|nr:MAG: hypothetical protein KatS3mg105_4487 [Gemmatales bacterium]